MSETTNTFADIVNELQRSYNFLVSYYKLDDPKWKDAVITLQSAGRRSMYGWHSAGRWVEGDNRRTELNICAEYLDRGADEIIETLLHEMAHLKNSIAGIKDCNPANQYHNKNFKESAEFFGLLVEKMGLKGFAQTSLGDGAKAAIVALNPNRDVYGVFRPRVASVNSQAGKYMAIFIDSSYSEKVDEACEKAGMTKKKLVEHLIDTISYSS